MLVTREADYAIRCVLEVARHGRISAGQIAVLQGISPTFLGKIVQSLARAGILSTRRGVGGGVSLALPIEQITVLQVIEAVEGPICLNECLANPPQCPHTSTCPAYPLLQRVQDQLRETLSMSFATLVAEGLPESPLLMPAVEDLEDLEGWSGNGRATKEEHAGGEPR